MKGTMRGLKPPPTTIRMLFIPLRVGTRGLKPPPTSHRFKMYAGALTRRRQRNMAEAGDRRPSAIRWRG